MPRIPSTANIVTESFLFMDVALSFKNSNLAKQYSQRQRSKSTGTRTWRRSLLFCPSSCKGHRIFRTTEDKNAKHTMKGDGLGNHSHPSRLLLGILIWL